jgi:large subunit ribosomal protein L13
MERNTHTIDATGKAIGRLAADISILLRGKQKPEFTNNTEIGDFVIVQNIAQAKITGKKLEQKKYYSHSGFPKGLKEVLLGKLFKENPQEVLKRAVYGMLPKNRLRPIQIKRLRFK